MRYYVKLKASGMPVALYRVSDDNQRGWYLDQAGEWVEAGFVVTDAAWDVTLDHIAMADAKTYSRLLSAVEPEFT
jgi:hypothetical protein